MNTEDRDLFERLFCAVVASAEGDGPFNWGIITRDAHNALSAIRAAEGEEAQEPTQSVRTIGGGAGTARDLTAEDTINGLRSRLREAESRADALVRLCEDHAAWRDTVQSERKDIRTILTRATGPDRPDYGPCDLASIAERQLRQAEAIIHALVDERASQRRLHRRTLLDWHEAYQAWGADDPKGAADEDPLTDVERMVVRAVEQGPCDDDELCLRLGLGHCGFMLTRRGAALWKAFCGLERAGVIERHFEEPPPEPPPVNRMPVAPFEVPHD